MISVNQNSHEIFYPIPIDMAALPNLTLSNVLVASSIAGGATPSINSPSSSLDDASKKVRKPYTISKSRESWSDPEHDKFLEAIQLFDRDWKKIEAFIGSKTVIQIRSHAQKYFLKVQKSGANEHLPPPRPKRKSAHPYPQKASKSAPMLPGVASQFPNSLSLPEHAFVQRPDSASLHNVPFTVIPPWPDVGAVSLLQDETASAEPLANTYRIISTSNERNSDSKTLASCGMTDQGDLGPERVLPDFAQVYSFIGSVFDPNVTGHMQKLKKLDPIDLETVLLLMRNLSINLSSPDVEDHILLLSSHETELGKDSSTTASQL